MIAAVSHQPVTESRDDLIAYVTVEVAGQLFGIPIDRLHDVFVVDVLTRVPLASSELAGLVNLRGRIVTVVDLRRRLGLPAAPPEARRMAVGIDDGAESFALLIDSVGEVLRLPRSGRADIPVHMAGRWAALAAGIHQLEDRLLIIVDVDAALSFGSARAA